MTSDIMGISSAIYDSWKRDSQFAKYKGMLSMLAGVPVGKVLDVGIGTALFEEFLCSKGIAFDAVGIEPNPVMAEKARRKGYTVVIAFAESLPFEDSTFDFVLCTDVLHLSKDPAKAVAEMHRVLKPGGHMLISMFCNTFTKGEAMAGLERLVSGWDVVQKGIVGRPDAELSAVVLCRKWHHAN